MRAHGREELLALGFRAVGENCRVVADSISVGDGVVLGDNVVVAGDRVVLGDGVVLGDNCDLRSSALRIGPRSSVGARARVLVADRFETGCAARLLSDIDIECREMVAGDLLFLGDRTMVGGGGQTASTARVTIGHCVALGAHCTINANCEIQLDDQVGSGDYLSLWTHGFHFGHSPLDGYQSAFSPIHIERNVWLAHHVTVLPGTSIGANTIVGACSVVNRSLPADVLAAGVPAKPRKRLETQPVSAAGATAIISDALFRWTRELQWKGLRVEELDAPRGVRAAWAVRGGATGAQSTAAFLTERNDAFSFDSESGVVVSLSEQPALADRLPSRWALLEPRERAYYGASFELAEDLRDFLRRESIPCGRTTLFESIEPEPFARLRAMAPPSGTR